MANELIDNALITQFSDQIHVQAQQIKARLRPYVEVRPMTGEIYAYDGLGPVEANPVVGRQQPVQFSDINHLRRQIARQRFVLTLPIDAADVRGMLLNPQGEYAKACVRAMERVFDRIVVASLNATVYTGRAMGTAVTAANDGVLTVTATAGFVYQTLLTVHKNFMDNDVGNDIPEKLVMGMAGNEYVSLMQEVELINDLYSQQYAIDKGRMMSAAGIEIVQFAANVAKPILAVASSVRSCFAMSTRGVCVGMSKEFALKVEPRPDLIETTQVQIVFDLGAVRTEGVLVQMISTTAS
jgi:Phage capsid protein